MRRCNTFVVLALLAISLAVGTSSPVVATVEPKQATPTREDPLIKSEVFDTGSNLMLVTSETFCIAPPLPGQPYPHDPQNCPRDPLRPLTDTTISEVATFQQIYKQQGPTANAQQFILGNRVEGRVDQNRAAAGRRYIDSIPVDFTGNRIDSFVSAWEGPNRSVQLVVALPISTTIQQRRLSVSEALNRPLVTPISGDNDPSNGHIHLAGGDMTGDGAEEFAVAYQGDDGKLHVAVYANRGVELPQLLASTASESLPRLPVTYARFDITMGDFDGSGDDELALAYLIPNADGAGNWGVFARIYDLDGATLRPKAGGTAFASPRQPNNTNLANLSLALTSGNFDQDGPDELAVASFVHLTERTNGIAPDNETRLALVEIGDDAATPTADPLERIVRTRFSEVGLYSYDTDAPLDVAAGNLNNSGADEIVLAAGPILLIFTADSQLNPTLALNYDATRDGLPSVRNLARSLGYRFLGVRDVGGGRVEIALGAPTISSASGSETQSISLVVYTATSNLGALTLVAKELNTNQITTKPQDYRRFALAVGGPNSLRLREPTYKGRVTKVSQPLVVVKAPPTHFDIVGGTVYDISDCLNADVRLACGGLENKFTVTFVSGSTTKLSVGTEFNSDWALSTSVGGELSVAAVALKSNITRTYGERFSKVAGTTRSYSDISETYVWQDDKVLATIMDYDVYEYDVLAAEQAIGNVLVVRPVGAPTLTWFGAKDWTGAAFIPDSQPGNILSFRKSLEEIKANDPGQTPLLKDNSIKSQVISRDSSFGDKRTISYSQDFDTSQTRERRLELEVSAEAGLAKDFGKFSAGLSVGVNGKYSKSELSTQQVSVGDAFEFRLVYGNVKATQADANYRVTPYIYWGSNGAVLIDYAVQPEFSAPGQPLDWWRRTYGQQPDPAFLLPWRFDEERLGYETPAYKSNLTKDILFDPPNAQAGEVVTLTARIHNYSLLATGSAPKVRFYVGDPDAGGTPIVGLGGQTVVTPSGPLEARGSAIVQMPWRVSQGLRYPRIYAVIDPDKEVAEVHEDNNKAYAVLGAFDGAGPPLAGFNAFPDSPTSLTVSFVNASSGQYTGIAWDFGDGKTSTLANPVHTFPAPGTYLVTLRLTGGPDGTTDAVQQRVRVGVDSGGRLYLPVLSR